MPIFDQGYQHWSGTLTGHAWRWLTIARHGTRAGMKNPFLRILVIVSWLPAVGLAFILCVWGLLEQNSPLVAPLRPFLGALFNPAMLEDPRHYRLEVWTLSFHYFLQTELRVSMIVILLVGPSLISQDLRFNALPLYFSRPLRRFDYFCGKLGVIAYFLGMVLIVPSLIAYILGLLFSLDLSIVRDTFGLLLSCLAYGAVIILSAGTLVLALSSLSRNSRFVALFWLALWFVSSIVGTILDTVADQQRRVEFYQKEAEASGQRARQKPPMRQRPGPVDFEKQIEEFQANEMQASLSNWRPLVSYTANLSRVGRRLLDTDAALRNLSLLEPAWRRDQFMLSLGPHYPWYWSAGVLAVLFGLSTCILHYRVRSLDRLK
jgi:ABC-2 type transport system permease protein